MTLLFYGACSADSRRPPGTGLFYEPAYYLDNPLEILAVWKGGMSFTAVSLGVLVAMGFGRAKHGKHWFDVTDFIAPLVPLAWLPDGWAISSTASCGARRRPRTAVGDDLPAIRRCSRAIRLQLYHVGLEGLALFAILWLYSRQVRPVGAVSGVFLIGYGTFRFHRIFPDARMPAFSAVLHDQQGQWLSLPMILIGIAMVVLAYRKKSL